MQNLWQAKMGPLQKFRRLRESTERVCSVSNAKEINGKLVKGLSFLENSLGTRFWCFKGNAQSIRVESVTRVHCMSNL